MNMNETFHWQALRVSKNFATYRQMVLDWHHTYFKCAAIATLCSEAMILLIFRELDYAASFTERFFKVNNISFHSSLSKQ